MDLGFRRPGAVGVVGEVPLEALGGSVPIVGVPVLDGLTEGKVLRAAACCPVGLAGKQSPGRRKQPRGRFRRQDGGLLDGIERTAELSGSG